MIIREIAVDERPRERLLKEGKESLSNAELLALLIGSGSANRSAIDLGNDIISLGKGGLAHLADCRTSELMKVEGVGEAKACRIVAGIELAKRIASSERGSRPRITSAAIAADTVMEKMRYHKKEYFNALLLDAKGTLICEENIAVGDLSSSIVHPRESFTSAVRLSAASVIFVHNHPSGDPSPSDEDRAVTDRLVRAGDILGINVLDHIIVGDGRYVSFRELGYI